MVAVHLCVSARCSSSNEAKDLKREDTIQENDA